ncbi:MAG: MFS transporter [Planctomycetota bacterium]|nr:MFS transporter [Planctomycetota bacterium]
MDNNLSDSSPSGDSDQQPRPGARRALVLLLTINMFNYIDRFVLAAVLVSVGKDMLAGDPFMDTKKGWLATAFLFSYMIVSPLFGWLADRFSRWVLIGVGVILWSLASGASGLAGSYMPLLITRLFVGVGEAAYGPVAPTIISDLYPVSIRGKVLSWFYMAIPVGSALGYVLGGAAASLGNWRWGFYAVVPPGIFLGLLCFFMPEPKRGSADAVAAPRKATTRDYLSLFKNPSYVLNCLGMAALTFSIGGMAYWMPNYVQQFRHWGDEGSVSIVFGAITVVTGVAATLLGGIAGDKLRGRIRGAYFIVSAIGLLAAFPFFLLMLFVPFPWAWICVFLAEFCLFFNTGPSNTALANVAHPAIRATAFAVNIFFIHALGDAISPPIIGRLSDITGGNMNVGFGAVGAMMIAGAIFWFWGSRYLDHDTENASHQIDRPQDVPVNKPIPPTTAGPQG